MEASRRVAWVMCVHVPCAYPCACPRVCSMWRCAPACVTRPTLPAWHRVAQTLDVSFNADLSFVPAAVASDTRLVVWCLQREKGGRRRCSA